MPNKASTRNNRYSRPPSLSTIGSNEEADFSASRRNRQTFQSAFSVSPLVEDHSSTFHHSQPSTTFNRRSEVSPLEGPPTSFQPYANQNEVALSEHSYDGSTVINSDTEKLVPDHEVKKPKHVFSKSFFITPPMERPDTACSSQSDSETGTSVKYMKTRYMWMLLQLDQIPWWHNTLAALAAWIVLAAYLVVPGTFTTFQENNKDFNPNQVGSSPEDQINAVANHIVDGVQHLGLLIFSGILAGSGGFLCLVLYFLHWQNYVWLSTKIFQPMMLNALAGLLTTIVSVETTQKGAWSVSAKINASVTGSVAATAGGLFILYNFSLIKQVREQHRKHFPVDAELVDPMKANRFRRRVGRYLPNQKGYSKPV